ncbi:hypothetical protein E1B28_002824 [Marasmius oreades]|uniref:UvrD-like helicase ATP-binding domain-containing protein n=1 Tax=Marasmius oreades TaxID=181124 RepID=A0A9P7RNJ3_9AGAR|nr:uncharacterized protein E1B28_002824 [Marasmius oreades]KAG7086906.1 hypothetical protein E1B28_002824 [Marasmius oreades]
MAPHTVSPISNVLPMKAALQFDNAEGFGEWRIYISTRANRDLRDARCRDPKLFTIIVKKIKELSNGHFSDDNQKRLNHSAVEVPIFEAKMTRDTRLVYQVDCVPEDENRERQTLKIFGIYTHAQLDKRLWSSLGNHLARNGKEYRRRVTYRTRPLVDRDNVYFPASFPPVEREEQEDGSQLPVLPKEDLEELHSLLVLEKFVPFTHTLLSCILADLDVSYVPKLSVEEEEIVRHSQSCYVLGRSGTGKTATMMWKMFGIERAYQQMTSVAFRPRQVFVTQSRSLAIRVEESFLKLTKALTTQGKTNKELVQLARINQETQEECLVDQDEEEEYRSTLPTRFSELKDEHFPLFVTFDKLCKLLEADVFGSEHRARPVQPPGALPSDAVEQSTGVLITYEVFLERYWPHFSQSLTKGLDPSLVFSEIMGVIKGSEEACRSEDRYLSRDAYEHLSIRMQATFATQRSRVYELFEQYLRQKRLNGDFDSADRTHKLLAAFKNGTPPALGQRFDYLCVDEVQDNLLIDTLLMRLLCRNPTGLFWAGDTAQTISVGSSFRFNDLKSFLYRLEEESFKDEPGMSTRSSEPVTFQLTTNYRSHSGILNCAHTVIELIVKFWPYSIDVLKPGKGLVDGIKPVFFRGWDQSNVRYEQFLFKASSGNYIEFGAKQCILVRNEAAREKLRQHVGDIGLIMTLYESKGLEFDDVLLFDFFEDSAVDLSQWRVVLNLIPPSDRNFISAPRFEETQHAGVNSELKFLYVAITRARKNMWIVDRSGRGEPMRLLWASRDQIEDCTPETGVPDLAVSSTSSEWAETARALFDRKQFFHAMKCYEKASMKRETMISEAYHLRLLARRLPKSTRKGEIATRALAFRKAAQAFLDCVDVTKKGSKDRLTYYRNAAEAFETAEDFKVAAETYVLAGEFGIAGLLYRQHGFFDEAVDVVKRYRSRMAEDTAESIIFVARLYYFRENKLRAANELFDSVEEELEFCEDYDLDVAKASLLEAIGDVAGAAQLHMEEGRIMEAITLLLKDTDSETSQAKAADYILDGFWGLGLFGSSAEKFTNDVRVKKLLGLVGKINAQKLTLNQQEELEMFRAIFENQKSPLERLGLAFHKKKQHHSALLCLDQRFTHFPNIQVMNAVEITPVLKLFTTYASLLSDIASRSDACSLPEVQHLFNFKMTTQNVFLLAPGSYLHSAVLNGPTRIISSSDEGISVTYADLLHCLHHELKFRARSRILEENLACWNAQAFIPPCLAHTILGLCNRMDCRRPHIEKGDLTPERYNAQIRIYLQQFLILRSFPLSGEGDEQRIKRREWMDGFFQVLYPPYHTLGSVSCLRASSIPEARRGMQVLKYWSQDTLEKAVPPSAAQLRFFLTRVSRAANIALSFGEDGQTSYVYNSKAATTCASLPVYRRVTPNGFTKDLFRDYLCTIRVTEKTSIIHGFNFVKHIVNTKIPFDIGMLCDVVDLTCAALIVARTPTPFHNLTMPRSWFLMLFPKLDPASRVDVIPPLEMVNLIGQILNVVHAGLGEFLSFEGHDLLHSTSVRNVLVARLCRAICFLGYNERCAGIHRLRIIEILNKLRTVDQRFRVHPIFAKYADARKWGEVARMIHTPETDSPMDRIITLSSRGEAREKPGHSIIVCPDFKQIPFLLGQPAPFTSKLRADAPKFVPSFAQPSINSTAAPTEPAEEVEVEDQDEDVRVVEDDPQDVVELSKEEEAEESNARPRTEEEISAVITIQQAYRRIRRHRQPSSNARVAAFFKVAQAEASSIPWKSNRYRFLLLGAIPHAMVCLDTIDGWAKAQKLKNKKKFAKGSHEDIETNGKALTGVVQFLKTIRELKSKLEPKSKFHKGRDIVQLKNHVRELKDLFSRVHATHPGVLNEVNDDLSVVVQSVLVGPVKPVEAPKVNPPLNTEDLD